MRNLIGVEAVLVAAELAFVAVMLCSSLRSHNSGGTQHKKQLTHYHHSLRRLLRLALGSWVRSVWRCAETPPRATHICLRHSAQMVELRTDGTILQSDACDLKTRNGLQLADDGRVVGMLPRAGEFAGSV